MIHEEYRHILDLVSDHQSVVPCCESNQLFDELFHSYKQQKNETDHQKTGMSEMVCKTVQSMFVSYKNVLRNLCLEHSSQ